MNVNPEQKENIEVIGYFVYNIRCGLTVDNGRLKCNYRLNCLKTYVELNCTFSFAIYRLLIGKI